MCILERIDVQDSKQIYSCSGGYSIRLRQSRNSASGAFGFYQQEAAKLTYCTVLTASAQSATIAKQKGMSIDDVKFLFRGQADQSALMAMMEYLQIIGLKLDSIHPTTFN